MIRTSLLAIAVALAGCTASAEEPVSDTESNQSAYGAMNPQSALYYGSTPPVVALPDGISVRARLDPTYPGLGATLAVSSSWNGALPPVSVERMVAFGSIAGQLPEFGVDPLGPVVFGPEGRQQTYGAGVPLPGQGMFVVIWGHVGVVPFAVRTNLLTLPY
jgi:hypothetical protein